MWPIKAPPCEQIVTLALLVHDFSWITLRPEIGIPAMTIGLFGGTYLTVSSWRARSPDLYCHASLLFWLVGNVIWTMSEYIWDEGYPVGFLSEIDFFTALSPSLYPVMMYVALSVQTTTSVGLIGYYVTRWARWKRQRAAYQSQTSEPLVPEGSRGFLRYWMCAGMCSASLADGVSPAEAYVLFPWLSLRMYYELFTLPWILMDTLWSYSNLQDALHGKPGPLCLTCSTLSGVAAIAIALDCVRRLLRSGQRSEAGHALAEGFWVTGNVLWMLEDSVTKWSWMFQTAVGCFATGCFVVLGAMALAKEEAGDSHTEDARFMQATQEACHAVSHVATPPSVQPGVFIDVDGANEHAAMIAVREPTKKKKKDKPWRSKKTPRLMKRVTVLPRGLSDKMPNFTRKVARLALNSYGDPQAPIALIDLGKVRQQLLKWRSLLPRVQPHFAVHSHADKKIVQLLAQDGCGFACTTADEVNMVLSLGVRPEDVVFNEVCKLKTHLTFVKEKGVQMMPFDNAAELQKIASEYPGARLLMQLAPPKTRPSAVQFGATKEEWAPLLELATELGLDVGGISLRVCPGGEEWESFGAALADAKEAIKVGHKCGYSMEVLDLGGVNAANAADFNDVAADMQRELSEHFPGGGFAALRIIASPGHLLTRCASGLLARVIAKDAEPQVADVEADGAVQRVQYVLNAGVYGPFSQIIMEREKLVVPMAVSLGVEDRPSLRCRFVGPTRDDLDVVLNDAILPELELGEWLLWPGVAPPSSGKSASVYFDDSADDAFSKAQVWYYAEDGSLADQEQEV